MLIESRNPVLRDIARIRDFRTYAAGLPEVPALAAQTDQSLLDCGKTGTYSSGFGRSLMEYHYCLIARKHRTAEPCFAMSSNLLKLMAIIDVYRMERLALQHYTRYRGLAGDAHMNVAVERQRMLDCLAVHKCMRNPVLAEAWRYATERDDLRLIREINHCAIGFQILAKPDTTVSSECLTMLEDAVLQAYAWRRLAA